MSDLVERLDEQAQNYSDGHGPLHAEAAAEIKQLKAALLLSQSQNYCTLCGRALEGK
jgi:hypothetical protein